MTADHLNTWTRDEGETTYRLDLWDTGRTDSYGKSELRYTLAIIAPPVDSRPVLFDGEDFHPSPLVSVDSDECAAALLSFFSAYGESIRYSGDDADVPADLTARQREALATHGEALGLWSSDLEVKQRLEYLRSQLDAERISYGELAELQGLADHIEPGDVQLLEAAGVPEQSPDVWTLLEESPPAGCEATQDLYSWSLNYPAGCGPFALLLDLIGWTEDEGLGEPLYSLADSSLGYLELDKLGLALREYSDRPQDVRAYVDQLMEAEARS